MRWWQLAHLALCNNRCRKCGLRLVEKRHQRSGLVGNIQPQSLELLLLCVRLDELGPPLLSSLGKIKPRLVNLGVTAYTNIANTTRVRVGELVSWLL